MTNMLMDTVSNMFFSLGISERSVLVRCHDGLVGENPVVTRTEADWVIRRMAYFRQHVHIIEKFAIGYSRMM